jgi:hypothetical protein
MKPDGGPAFPGATEKELGLSIRDYFAAAALAELANSTICYTPDKAQTEFGLTWADILAEQCYDVADAMIKYRLL